MRDPARIPVILEALRVEWEKAPDLRLGQLIVNATAEETSAPSPTLFYVEDERLVQRIRALVESSQRVQALVRKVEGECLNELNELRAKYDKDISDAEIAHQAEVARLRELAEHRGKLLVKQLEATQAETRAHEATKAEIVRLREELSRESAEWSKLHQKLHDEVYRERTAHEATKRQAEELRRNSIEFHGRAAAAEARVAELERAFKQEEQDCIDESDAHEKTKVALDQTRGLLEESKAPSITWRERRDNWLRAHPATPPDPFESAEKERGT